MLANLGGGLLFVIGDFELVALVPSGDLGYTFALNFSNEVKSVRQSISLICERWAHMRRVLAFCRNLTCARNRVDQNNPKKLCCAFPLG